MYAAYALSEDPVAKAYPGWQKYNRVPFDSASHGRRYVNVYVNPTGRHYGQLTEGEKMPVGTFIAKDSFSATDDGDVNAGPLFVMEKMRAGFNYVSGDWRYTMVMPDGSLFGTTKGYGAERVEFCIGCHLAREKQDHLFLVPEAYRAGGYSRQN